MCEMSRYNAAHNASTIRKMQPVKWISDYAEHYAWFCDQQDILTQERWTNWPNCVVLNRLWREQLAKRNADHAYNSSGKILTFRSQSELSNQALYYEQHIYETGEIPTRDQNWHDYFNAMIWIQFPKIKAAINNQHIAEIAKQGEVKKRTRKRDALTLFDESGLIIVSADQAMINAHQVHDWQTLFLTARDQWHKKICIFIFGHGLYEKSLSPYIGMTGNALHIKMKAEFFQLTRDKQAELLDKKIANEITQAEQLTIPKDLTPLPMLGVPGWWAENTNPAFYSNTDYFRPKRKI